MSGGAGPNRVTGRNEDTDTPAFAPERRQRRSAPAFRPRLLARAPHSRTGSAAVTPNGNDPSGDA